MHGSEISVQDLNGNNMPLRMPLRIKGGGLEDHLDTPHKLCLCVTTQLMSVNAKV